VAEGKKNYVISPADFRQCIESGSEFQIQFNCWHNETEAAVTRIIYRFLEKYDIHYLRETVVNIMKELVNNAIKANLKRLYFQMKNLDINKTDDYRTGMESFKAETYQPDDTTYLDQLDASDLHVRIVFGTSDTHISIGIHNNSPILEVELSKIQSRVKKAFKYTDIAEAFDDVLDDSEGAGLGLIMAIMLLKNSGLTQETLQVSRDGGSTIATISIPKSLTNIESQKRIAEEIVKEIEEIPSMPENIQSIQRLCSNPDSTIREISDNIAHDPALTASILKLANSAGYLTGRKIETLTDAVKNIGIKGINTLLVATGVHRILDSRYKRYEKMWKESNKRAFYSQKIAIQMKQAKQGDFAYLAGLLADIGFIIILSLKADLWKRVQDIAGIKGINPSVPLEEISLGISHSSLGAMICAKWNFNEALIKAIEYHHRPYMSPEEHRQLVYIVYLANCYIDYENGKMRYELIHEDALQHFGINDKERFISLHELLRESYEQKVKANNI
jgi:HD-like signal output (HDOD) protein